MPNRIIRDGILSSERVTMLGWPAEVFYRRLHSVVDDYGRYYASPMLLRAACYPLHLDKVSDADIGKWLQATEKAGLVSVYLASDGKRYLQVADFRQQIRAKDSKFPAPAEHLLSTCVASAHLDGGVDGGVSEDGDESAPTHGRGKKKAKEQTLTGWLDSLGGADAVPADDQIFAWAQTQTLPRDWIAIAWWIFESRYEDKPKTYADWRAVFRKAVREDWLKAWRQSRDGQWELTTAGVQAQREMAHG